MLALPGDARLRRDHHILADAHVVPDVHQVVDLRARARSPFPPARRDRWSYSPRSPRHLRSPAPDLRKLLVCAALFIAHIPEPVASQHRSRMHDHAIAQRRARVDRHLRDRFCTPPRSSRPRRSRRGRRCAFPCPIVRLSRRRRMASTLTSSARFRRALRPSPSDGPRFREPPAQQPRRARERQLRLRMQDQRLARPGVPDRRDHRSRGARLAPAKAPPA